MLLIIYKMIATSGFLTGLVCTKVRFGQELRSAGGAYNTPTDPVAVTGLLRGTYF